MKEIILNKVKPSSIYYKKYIVLLDDEDYDFINQWNWSVKPHGKTFYATRNDYNNGKKKLFLHRVLLKLNNPQIIVDHKDHNGLNNQKYNLRICTQKLNSKNRGVDRNKAVQYKGVSIGYGNKFISRIRVEGELIHLGTFNTEVEAALKYNEASIKYHGDFGFLNNINNNIKI